MRVEKLLKVLPAEITPVNLEELRRVKQALVELESKADQLRYSRSSLHHAVVESASREDEDGCRTALGVEGKQIDAHTMRTVLGLGCQQCTTVWASSCGMEKPVVQVLPLVVLMTSLWSVCPKANGRFFPFPLQPPPPPPGGGGGGRAGRGGCPL